MREAHSLLQSVFGHGSFRSGQEDAVRAVLSGKDVLLLAPTGGGKSVCYQLPALVKPGLTIVISPLIALMQNQVQALQNKGIVAECMGSHQGKKKNDSVYAMMYDIATGMGTAAPTGSSASSSSTFPASSSSTQSTRGKQTSIRAFFSNSASGKQESTPDDTSGKNVASTKDEEGEGEEDEDVEEYEDEEDVVKVKAGALKILYVSPETAATDTFLTAVDALVKKRAISLLAIDEAHCISTWGHDFRKSYRRLEALRRRLRGVSVIAVTATATNRVRMDIVNSLALRDDYVCIVQSFNRPNIFYQVKYKEVLQNDNPVLSILGVVCSRSFKNSTGIVYAGTRKMTEEIADTLGEHQVSAAAYHAGLSAKRREEVQQDWMSGKKRVIVATIAFGMGIDKQDVRFVVHFHPPSSLESYYQESGRAGRDGKPSLAVLYYSQEDKRRQRFLEGRDGGPGKRGGKGAVSTVSVTSVAQKQQGTPFDSVISYCEALSCRRKALIEHFGEDFDTPSDAMAGKKCCDYCRGPEKIKKQLDMSLKVAAVSMSRLGTVKGDYLFGSEESKGGFMSRKEMKASLVDKSSEAQTATETDLRFHSTSDLSVEEKGQLAVLSSSGKEEANGSSKVDEFLKRKLFDSLEAADKRVSGVSEKKKAASSELSRFRNKQKAKAAMKRKIEKQSLSGGKMIEGDSSRKQVKLSSGEEVDRVRLLPPKQGGFHCTGVSDTQRRKGITLIQNALHTAATRIGSQAASGFTGADGTFLSGRLECHAYSTCRSKSAYMETLRTLIRSVKGAASVSEVDQLLRK